MTLNTLRKATRKDMARIFEIRQSVRENELDVTFDAYVAAAGRFVDDGCCWVWEENGRVLGEAGYNPATGYVEVLYVDPDAHGRGIGRALLQQCRRDLVNLGHKTATLSTTGGTRAERIYRQAGWEEIGIDTVGDLRFRKQLSARDL